MEENHYEIKLNVAIELVSTLFLLKINNCTKVFDHHLQDEQFVFFHIVKIMMLLITKLLMLSFLKGSLL